MRLLTFVQVGTGGVLRGKRLRPIQDGHVREPPLEKVVRRGKTEAPSSNDDNREIWLYCRHLGDANVERKFTPEAFEVHQSRLDHQGASLFSTIRPNKPGLFIVRTHRYKLQKAMVAGPSTSIHKFREVVKSSRKIIVVAGAGLSAASGDHPSELLEPPFIPLTNCHR